MKHIKDTSYMARKQLFVAEARFGRAVLASPMGKALSAIAERLNNFLTRF